MIALVPFGICLTRRPMNMKWLGIYYLFALVWFQINLDWLWGLTPLGTIALGFFCAVWVALSAFAAQRLMFHLRWPAMIALPIAWVAGEYLRSTILSGFPWFLLGNAMTTNVLFLQAADLFGVWGMSFFCAMTSGVIVDLMRLPLRKGKKTNPQTIRLAGCYGAVLAFVIIYGLIRLYQSPFRDGPTIAVVQAVIPQDVDAEKQPDPVTTFDQFLALTKKAATQKPDLIVWPESMVLWPVNREWLEIPFIDPDTRRKQQEGQMHSDLLASTSHDTGCALLIGSGGFYIEGTGADASLWIRNHAILYTPDAGQNYPYYTKRHLVPFGEYVPFKSSWPWLNSWLVGLMPKGFVPDEEPGEEWTRFTLADRDGKSYHFGTPICYEDVMPEPCQSFVDPDSTGKRTDFLISLTNDGWYHSVNELDQHLQMSQMRAVENRVPMIRSVNPGNSGFIDSCGRVVKLVEVNGESHFVAGTAQWKLQLDSRVSLFSRIGDLFAVICGCIAALAVGWTIVRPRRKNADALTVAA